MIFQMYFKTLINMNRTDPTLRSQLDSMIEILTKEFKTTLEEGGSYTVFVPTDRAFRKSLSDSQVCSFE